VFSDGTLKELAFDCLVNRYLMISFQSMEANMETISKIEYVINLMPPEWLTSNVETTGTMTLPQLANMCRLIRRIADSIHTDEFKANKIDKSKFK
jgi:hypothetical protein